MTTPTSKGLPDAFMKSCRYAFEQYYKHWHEFDTPDLLTWSEAGVCYTNLKCNDEFRAYCCGRFDEQNKKGR